MGSQSYKILIKLIQFDDELSFIKNFDTKNRFFFRYLGDWNILGFSGVGTYRFPHGVLYDGNFNRNGDFHGIGSLVFPNGQTIRGLWKKGHLLKDATFVFSCGEILDELHKYCVMPDRRYHIEIQHDLNPAGQEYVCNSEFPQKLPPGTYDIGDGIFYPQTERIMVPVKPPLFGFEITKDQYKDERYFIKELVEFVHF